MFDRVLRIPRIINMVGLEYTRVLNLKNATSYMLDRIPNIPQVLNMTGSKYVRVTQSSEQNFHYRYLIGF